MTRPREGPDARSMSPSEAAAKKIADNTIEILRAERDRLFNTVAQQAAEIERLRAFEMAARDLNNDLTRIAKERDEMATQIKKLKEDLEQAEICIRARLDVIDQLRVENKELQESLTAAYLLGSHKKAKELAPRIKELEDAHKRSGKKYAKIINELRSSVYANIPGLDVGKIGPDATKPRSWQITEERIGLLEYCLETLLDAPDIEEIPGPGHSIEMLRAMLREAEQ